MGTLFPEGRDRLLLNVNPMFGSYTPGLWSSSSSSSTSSALLASHTHSPAFPIPTAIAALTSSSLSAAVPTSAASSSSSSSSSSVCVPQCVLVSGEASVDSRSSALNAFSKMESEYSDCKDTVECCGGTGEVVDRDSSHTKAVDIIPNSKESQEQDPVLSSNSVRLKGTQEKERVDRLLRERWVKISDLASGMLAGPAANQHRSQAGGSKAKAAEVIGSAEVSQALGRNCHEMQNEGSSNGAVKTKVKKNSQISFSSSQSSSAATVADAQALLDAACSMQPYINAPGESFADTMRVVLGELMMVSHLDYSRDVELLEWSNMQLH